MKPFGVSCASNGCTERSTAMLDEAAVFWTKHGPFHYCPKHSAVVPSPMPTISMQFPREGEGGIRGVYAKEPDLLEGEASPGEFRRRDEMKAAEQAQAARLDAALAAMTDLVAGVIKDGSRLRFQQAERLCRLAHDVQSVLDPRTADFLGEDVHQFDINDNPPELIGGGLRRVQRWNPRMQNAAGNVGGDQGEMLRGMMATLSTFTDHRNVSEDASAAESEARELNMYLEMPKDLQQRFAARIAQLEKRIMNRTKGDDDALVHPDVERGLQPGGEGQEDAPARERPDGG